MVTGASDDRAGADLNKPLTVPEADISNLPECLTLAASVFRMRKGVSPAKVKEMK